MLDFKIPLDDGTSVTLVYPSRMSEDDHDMVKEFLTKFWDKKRKVLTAQLETPNAEQGA